MVKINTMIGSYAAKSDPTESDMPRYVQYASYADGSSYYRYNPPQEFVDRGIVRREVLSGDRISAFQQADEWNNLIDTFRIEENQRVTQGRHDPSVDGLCQMYLESAYFEKLATITQDQYRYFINKLCKTVVPDKDIPFGDIHFTDVTNGMAARVYETVMKSHRTRGGDGIVMANHILSVAKRVWSVANKWEVIHRNPWRFVETFSPKKRTMKWTEEQIKSLLNTAFSKWEWRNVGVMTLLAYETSQRPGDCRLLRWPSIRFDTKEFILVNEFDNNAQNKRQGEVIIPLADNVMDVLDQNLQEFGEQPYVCPHPKTLQPYKLDLVSKTFQRIREAAGLPDGLWMRDIRRTVISELGDKGATEAEIMAWSGHKNSKSLEPYLKPSKIAGQNAFNKRKNPREV